MLQELFWGKLILLPNFSVIIYSVHLFIYRPIIIFIYIWPFVVLPCWLYQPTVKSRPLCYLYFIMMLNFFLLLYYMFKVTLSTNKMKWNNNNNFFLNQAVLWTKCKIVMTSFDSSVVPMIFFLMGFWSLMISFNVGKSLI